MGARLIGECRAEWIQKQRRVDHQTNTSILYQLLLGLRHVHSQGIIHRDIKVRLFKDTNSFYEVP
jgi:serine/threonine protein kinase